MKKEETPTSLVGKAAAVLAEEDPVKKEDAPTSFPPVKAFVSMIEPKGSKLSSKPELWLPEDDSLPRLLTLRPSLPDLVVGEPGGDEKSMRDASVAGVLGADEEI